MGEKIAPATDFQIAVLMTSAIEGCTFSSDVVNALIARIPAEREAAIKQCAAVAYVICIETADAPVADKVHTAILSLSKEEQS